MVQLVQVLRLRNRHQMVPAEVTDFALDSALFVAPRRIAELRLESPVRAKSNQALRLLSLMPAQNLLHRTLQVVVAQAPKHATEIVKCPLMCFQKCLLRGVIVSHMKRSATRHRAHREVVNRLALAPDLGYCFVPIHLRLAAPVVDLRHERLSPRESELLLTLPHIVPHRRFRYSLRALLLNPFPDAMRRVPLFARSHLICAQYLVNELHHRPQPGPVPHRPFALRRNRTGQCLSHHPPMHPQLLRDCTNRTGPMRVLPPDLFE